MMHHDDFNQEIKLSLSLNINCLNSLIHSFYYKPLLTQKHFLATSMKLLYLVAIRFIFYSVLVSLFSIFRSSLPEPWKDVLIIRYPSLERTAIITLLNIPLLVHTLGSCSEILLALTLIITLTWH